MKERDSEHPKVVEHPGYEVDEYAQSLTTLRDYREAMRNPEFSMSLFRASRDGSVYGATIAALRDIKVLLVHPGVRTDVAIFCCDCRTSYEMLMCIRLMEFPACYDAPLYDLLPTWPKRADPSVRVFDTAGFSCLHAAFDFVRETAKGIEHVLREAHRKLGGGRGLDDLEVSYPSHPVIEKWLHDVVARLQGGCYGKYGQSRMDVEAEFDGIWKQLADEREAWEATRQASGTAGMGGGQESGTAAEKWWRPAPLTQDEVREIRAYAETLSKLSEGVDIEIPEPRVEGYDYEGQQRHDYARAVLELVGDCGFDPIHRILRRNFPDGTVRALERKRDEILGRTAGLDWIDVRKQRVKPNYVAGTSIDAFVQELLEEVEHAEAAVLLAGGAEGRDEFLEGLVERLKKLRTALQGGGNSDEAREALTTFIKTPARLVETLDDIMDRCKPKGDARTRIQEVRAALVAYRRLYPAVCDPLADDKVIAQFERLQGMRETPTPETDNGLIYQADAAEFYNIPKSTLSKAAKKKPGEAGYLWSGTKGGRRFYRKADLLTISRSRRKLKGT